MIKDPKLFSVPSKTNLKSKPEPMLGSKTSAARAKQRRADKSRYKSRSTKVSISQILAQLQQGKGDINFNKHHRPHQHNRARLITLNFSSEPPTLTSNLAFPSLWIQDPVYARQIPTTSWLSPKRIPSFGEEHHPRRQPICPNPPL
jgi:hypothetical protein